LVTPECILDCAATASAALPFMERIQKQPWNKHSSPGHLAAPAGAPRRPTSTAPLRRLPSSPRRGAAHPAPPPP
jgi:hypothetical protein